MACFQHVSDQKKCQVLDGRISLKIFYVKLESVFMKYADEEAAAYNAMMEERKQEKAQQQANSWQERHKKEDRPQRNNRDNE